MQNKKELTIPEGKIRDYIDNAIRNDTPEEYVRQTIEKRLVNEHKYAPLQIGVEYTIQLISGRKRADLVVFPPNCKEKVQSEIKIIIECKKETIDPQNKKDGVGQLKAFMAVCPNCEWGMWTNGRQKEVYRKVKEENGDLRFDDYNDIPPADGNLKEIDRPQRGKLRGASGDSVNNNLLFAFKSCHNHIYANDGLQKQPAFFELLKLIFCKIEDERDIPNELEFYVTSSERSNPDGQLTVKKRIARIFEKVKRRYGKIFDPKDEIQLLPRSLAYIVRELQNYDLLNTSIDVKGKAYEEIVGANLRGDRGEFFTPPNITHMVVSMLNPGLEEKVLDCSCGTGGFLVNAMTYVMTLLKEELAEQLGKPPKQWTYDQRLAYQDKVSELGRTNYFGFDINPDLVKATKMNMVMNNDGSGNIMQTNSLLAPHEWSEDFKEKLSEALGIKKEDLRNHETIDFFDVVVTNPPFGSDIPVKDEVILSQYELARIWENKSTPGVWKKTERLQSSVPPEVLFIERCVQFLKPGGRLGIVLPDSILGSPGLGYIREWMIRNTYIIASIDLNVDTFQPHNGTQTSVLLLQKKTKKQKEEEADSGERPNYNIFMAMVEKIGHDKRGNPLFKRDQDGNEILVSIHRESDEETGEPDRPQKVPDDQTIETAAVFKEWKQREGITW
ncbi:MAG: N-6 DNA methylase [Clostridiales bacterium]|nr:N-6 DNA methylase [Clostridiales bacterium]